MSAKNGGSEKHSHHPSNTDTNHNPVNEFRKFIFSWPVLGTMVLGCLATYWSFVNNSPKALYLVCGALCVVIVVATHKLVVELESKDEKPAESGEVTPLDVTIPGTTFTHSKVGEIFPFGYALIYWLKDGTYKYDERKDTNKLLNWSVDWERVKIEPDVAAMRVKLSIPAKADTPSDGTTGAKFVLTGPDGTYPILVFNALLKTGTIAYGPVDVRNRPVLCVATLSDNQRTPVFAVGFRIKTDGERPVRPPRDAKK